MLLVTVSEVIKTTRPWSVSAIELTVCHSEEQWQCLKINAQRNRDVVKVWWSMGSSMSSWHISCAEPQGENCGVWQHLECLGRIEFCCALWSTFGRAQCLTAIGQFPLAFCYWYLNAALSRWSWLASRESFDDALIDAVSFACYGSHLRSHWCFVVFGFHH